MSNVIYKLCPKCSEQHQKQGLFCSRKCANSRTWSEEDKQKKSAGAKNFYNQGGVSPNKGKSNPRKGCNISGDICHVSWCKVCNKLIKKKAITCSKECSINNYSLKYIYLYPFLSIIFKHLQTILSVEVISIIFPTDPVT